MPISTCFSDPVSFGFDVYRDVGACSMLMLVVRVAGNVPREPLRYESEDGEYVYMEEQWIQSISADNSV